MNINQHLPCISILLWTWDPKPSQAGLSDTQTAVNVTYYGVSDTQPGVSDTKSGVSDTQSGVNLTQAGVSDNQFTVIEMHWLPEYFDCILQTFALNNFLAIFQVYINKQLFILVTSKRKEEFY